MVLVSSTEYSSASWAVARACVNKEVELDLGGRVWLHGRLLCWSPCRELFGSCSPLTDPVDAAFSGSGRELDMRRTSIESLCNVGV